MIYGLDKSLFQLCTLTQFSFTISVHERTTILKYLYMFILSKIYIYLPFSRVKTILAVKSIIQPWRYLKCKPFLFMKNWTTSFQGSITRNFVGIISTIVFWNFEEETFGFYRKKLYKAYLNKKISLKKLLTTLLKA